jgi:hypothetical protein
MLPILPPLLPPFLRPLQLSLGFALGWLARSRTDRGSGAGRERTRS